MDECCCTVGILGLPCSTVKRNKETLYLHSSLHFTFTCIHLSDAFIQSDLQERALQKVQRSMNDHKHKIAPKTLRVAKT